MPTAGSTGCRRLRSWWASVTPTPSTTAHCARGRRRARPARVEGRASRHDAARRQRPDSLDQGEAAQALAEGITLGWYQFLNYKSEQRSRRGYRGCCLVRRPGAKTREGARPRENGRRGGPCSARDLVNRPAEAKSPDHRGQKARAPGPRPVTELTVHVLGGRAARSASDSVACSGIPEGAPNVPRGSCGLVRATQHEGDARARRQGCGVRLRWPLDQDPRAAWRR